MPDARQVGRRAGAADVPAVAACLASAFHEDPLWGHWAFPDPAERERGLPALMTLMAELGQAPVRTHMTAGAEAVTVWTPRGEVYGRPEQDDMIAAAIDTACGPRAAAVHGLFDIFEQHRPREPHHHLEWWATHREHAGRGIGAALLREDLARIDELDEPCYLESTNPANLARYEALGFARIDAFGPPGGPVIMGMWRSSR